MTLSELQSEIWKDMEEKGFHTGKPADRLNTLARLALVHTEVSEATQEVKRHWADDGPRSATDRDLFAGELADVVIRILDLAGTCRFDLAKYLREKVNYNKTRPVLYGTIGEAK